TERTWGSSWHRRRTRAPAPDIVRPEQESCRKMPPGSRAEPDESQYKRGHDKKRCRTALGNSLAACQPAILSCDLRSAGWNRESHRYVSVTDQFGDIHVVQPICPNVPSRVGITSPVGIASSTSHSS